jgi:hypothetical protein
MAAVLVLGPIFEADLQPEQHAYRPERNAFTAVNQVHHLLNTGHTQIIDADLSVYFDSIPHFELLKSIPFESRNPRASRGPPFVSVAALPRHIRRSPASRGLPSECCRNHPGTLQSRELERSSRQRLSPRRQERRQQRDDWWRRRRTPLQIRQCMDEEKLIIETKGCDFVAPPRLLWHTVIPYLRGFQSGSGDADV